MRLGQGMSCWPRPDAQVSFAAYPATRSTPSRVSVRRPPPTSTTVASNGPWPMLHCSPVGHAGAGWAGVPGESALMGVTVAGAPPERLGRTTLGREAPARWALGWEDGHLEP